jgi:phospholipid/cholesterol/gamma-HCH transport system permease protein
MRPNRNDSAVAIQLHQPAPGSVKVVLQGRLDVQSAGQCWRELEKQLSAQRVSTLEVDVEKLEVGGSIGMILLQFLQEGGMTPGAQVSLRGLPPSAQKLVQHLGAEDAPSRPKPARRLSLLEEIGACVRGFLQDLGEQLSFTGSVVRVLPDVVAHPKQLRWGEVKRVMETAGANALPLVGLVSWLMGLVTALESVRPLERFGAQLLVADMVGFAAIRDIGPIITGIMLASRSGSGFAAELAAMKVNQELDALKAMGVEPIRFLVVQRVISALVFTPLMSFYAMLLAIIGGMMIMALVGFPPRMVFFEILSRTRLSDFGVGLVKSLGFGLIVGAVGCLRGLQAKAGPQAVGLSATRSVVTSIILIILFNTAYSSANYFLSRAT